MKHLTSNMECKLISHCSCNISSHCIHLVFSVPFTSLFKNSIGCNGQSKYEKNILRNAVQISKPLAELGFLPSV